MYAAPAFSEIAVARAAATSSRVAPALIAASVCAPMQPSQRVEIATAMEISSRVLASSTLFSAAASPSFMYAWTIFGLDLPRAPKAFLIVGSSSDQLRNIVVTPERVRVEWLGNELSLLCQVSSLLFDSLKVLSETRK